MIPKLAIEKAIEGGWSNPDYVDADGDETVELAMRYWQDTALDPTFWQTLGKAFGWAGFDTQKDNKMVFAYYEHEHWTAYAHRFYDLILQGKSTDGFWKELLANEETI